VISILNNLAMNDLPTMSYLNCLKRSRIDKDMAIQSLRGKKHPKQIPRTLENA
jgi:hypothetical protein